MNTQNWNWNDRQKKQNNLKVFGLIVALIIFCVVIYKNADVINEMAKDMPEYVSPGIYKVKIDDHEYLKSDSGLTHSESCPCKK